LEEVVLSRIRRSYRLAVAAAVTAAMGALPAAAPAAIVTFGSNLGSPAATAIAHPVDTAFWSTALSGGARARAPQSGQVLSIRIRGCAKRGSGGQAPLTQVHFQVLAPGAGSRATVKVTSGPANLPICGGAVSGATVTTFHPVNLCVGKGQSVDLNDEGGFSPAGFPNGVGYEVFAKLPGAATNSFTSGGGTGNGARLSGRAHAGLELLMQMQLGTGRNATPLCG
jgi:hypothetical protein